MKAYGDTKGNTDKEKEDSKIDILVNSLILAKMLVQSHSKSTTWFV